MSKVVSLAPERGQEPKVSRRDQLLDEAGRQFNASGVSLTSLTDIAEMLGVSRNALYYYVDDREDLVFQVYRRSCEIMFRRLGEAAGAGLTSLAVIEQFVAASLDPDEPELAALSELGLLRSAERETVLSLYEGLVARLASVLEAGARAGELRRCDTDIVARCILGLLAWVPLARGWTAAAEPATRSEIIATINDIIARGWAMDRRRKVDAPRVDLSALGAPAVTAFDRGSLADAKREAILLTASRLFNRKGIDTTSLDEIATELGATKGTLYHYVGDKPAIVLACYTRSFEINRYIRQRSLEVASGSVERWTTHAQTFAVAQMREDLEPLRQTAGLQGLSAEAQASMLFESRRIYEASRESFEALQREGQARPIDPNLLMLILPGASSWLVKGVVRADEARQLEIAKEINDLMRVGVLSL